MSEVRGGDRDTVGRRAAQRGRDVAHTPPSTPRQGEGTGGAQTGDMASAASPLPGPSAARSAGGTLPLGQASAPDMLAEIRRRKRDRRHGGVRDARVGLLRAESTGGRQRALLPH